MAERFAVGFADEGYNAMDAATVGGGQTQMNLRWAALLQFDVGDLVVGDADGRTERKAMTNYEIILGQLNSIEYYDTNKRAPSEQQAEPPRHPSAGGVVILHI